MANCEYTVVFPPNHPLSSVDRQQPVIYDEILCIDINNKGNTITASSSISDNYWEGTLFYYDSTQDANSNKSSVTHQCKSSVGVAKFFNDNTILLAEDFLPSLKLLSISEGKSISLTHSEDVEDRIISLSLWNHTSKAISSGNYISLWDIQNGRLTLLNHYANYHFDVVNDIDTCKSNEHVFTSVSSDKRAVLWDIRKETPAKIVYENEFSILTTVCFDPTNEYLNYLGSEAGDVYTVDLRKPNDFVHVIHCYDSYGVFRMEINNNTDTGVMLAVCGDGSQIKVFDVSNSGGLKVRYEHCSQNGATVRDIAWSPNDVLYSCGFNQEFSEHFMK